jgi:hypothetical protein
MQRRGRFIKALWSMKAKVMPCIVGKYFDDVIPWVSTLAPKSSDTRKPILADILG